MNALLTLALNGFRESRRNRVTLTVILFGIGLLLCTTLVTDVTVYTFDRVVTDIGLGAMSIILVILAIFLSSGQLSREIERRTIFLTVSKPISRSTFLIGRLAGNMLTLGVLLIAMAAVFFLEALLTRTAITGPMVTAIAVLWVELLVLTSVGFLMSSFSSQLVSAVVTTGVYFAGHLAPDIYTLASRSKSEAIRLGGKVVYYILPDLSRLNFRPRATYNLHAPASLIAVSVGYGFAYATVLIVLATVVFSRRDFK